VISNQTIYVYSEYVVCCGQKPNYFMAAVCCWADNMKIYTP